MSQLEGWSFDESVARCTEIDRIRSRFTRYFFGDKATQPAEYDLVFNTAACPLDDVVAVVAAIVRGALGGYAGQFHASAGLDPLARAWGRRAGLSAHARRAAGDAGLRPRIAGAGGRSPGRAGGRTGEDRRARAGIFQRFHPGSIYQRYFEALGQLMRELAERGNAILVGRGGSRILRDDPRAFHVRLVAPMPVRVRRVMEYRWVQESSRQEADCRQRLAAQQLL